VWETAFYLLTTPFQDVRAWVFYSRECTCIWSLNTFFPLFLCSTVIYFGPNRVFENYQPTLSHDAESQDIITSTKTRHINQEKYEVKTTFRIHSVTKFCLLHDMRQWTPGSLEAQIHATGGTLLNWSTPSFYYLCYYTTISALPLQYLFSSPQCFSVSHSHFAYPARRTMSYLSGCPICMYPDE